MNNLEQFFSSIGAKADAVVNRLGGSPELVVRFLSKFRSDSSFADLSAALAKNDTDIAFRAVHTLKGVCANLGFDNLFEKASTVTELLRGGDLDSAKLAFPELTEEYQKTIDALDRCGL